MKQKKNTVFSEQLCSYCHNHNKKQTTTAYHIMNSTNIIIIVFSLITLTN